MQVTTLLVRVLGWMHWPYQAWRPKDPPAPTCLSFKFSVRDRLSTTTSLEQSSKRPGSYWYIMHLLWKMRSFRCGNSWVKHLWDAAALCKLLFCPTTTPAVTEVVHGDSHTAQGGMPPQGLRLSAAWAPHTPPRERLTLVPGIHGHINNQLPDWRHPKRCIPILSYKLSKQSDV